MLGTALFKYHDMLNFLNRIYEYYIKTISKLLITDNPVLDITDYVILKEGTPDPVGEFILGARPYHCC